MQQIHTRDEIIDMIKQLPPAEQLRLLEQINTIIAGLADLLPQKMPLPAPAQPQPQPQPKRDFYGILAHLGPAPSAEEIDEVRREMWANFAEGDDW